MKLVPAVLVMAVVGVPSLPGVAATVSGGDFASSPAGSASGAWALNEGHVGARQDEQGLAVSGLFTAMEASTGDVAGLAPPFVPLNAGIVSTLEFQLGAVSQGEAGAFGGRDGVPDLAAIQAVPSSEAFDNFSQVFMPTAGGPGRIQADHADDGGPPGLLEQIRELLAGVQSPLPEPASLALIGLGLVGVGLVLRRIL